ncbi:hypothetical protein V6X30_03300 [Spiribacter sp. 1M189]|uniref:Uncharacterized protein n=1 Tax=Spiribacter insolitus TaxID=3122417 RepID=A0ABV3T6X9_9GAMM
MKPSRIKDRHGQCRLINQQSDLGTTQHHRLGPGVDEPLDDALIARPKPAASMASRVTSPMWMKGTDAACSIGWATLCIVLVHSNRPSAPDDRER